MSHRSKWSLVGIPDHQAVIHVGGRIGASRGPRQFRKILSTFKGRDRVLESLTDWGDAGPITQNVEANHRQASSLVERAHTDSGLSVIVGGSHDHGYSHLAGIREALSKNPGARTLTLGCINIDAHLDVRKPLPAGPSPSSELITSGSPFYLALESGVLEPSRFIEFGIQAHCNAPELWQYVESRKVRVVPFEELRAGSAVSRFETELKALTLSCDAIVVSLDIDSAAQCHAPGVSAPQSEGFSASEIVEICERAGAHEKVCSLGIFELNPEHDLDDRTARLCATAAYHFLSHALKAKAGT